MKARNLILFLVLFIQADLQANFRSDNPDGGRLLIDHVIRYKWDAINNVWQKALYNKYIYDDKLQQSEVVSMNPMSDDTISVSRAVYEYNSSGQVTAIYFQNRVSGSWVNTSNNLMEYDSDGHRISVTAQTWKNNAWINVSRQCDFEYNSESRLVAYRGQGWTGTEWKYGSYEFFYYDSAGNLIQRVIKDIYGINNSQLFYFYNSFNIRTGVLAQGWQKTTNTWYDIYRDTYTINSCGKRTLFLRERMIKGSWINEIKDEYYYTIAFPSGITRGKIAVCHNGHTIFISTDAVNSHLAHGDCLGGCLNEKNNFAEKKSGTQLLTPPFTVYPNPAKEMITVKFDQEFSGEAKRIELTDFYGKLIKVYIVKDNSDLIIYRGNLLSGQYYLRLIGKETISQMVIFE